VWRANPASNFCRLIPTRLGAVAAPTAKYLVKAEYGSVTIRFAVSKPCEFGSRLGIVGSLGQLGLWDASQALQLEWSDGHVWRGEIDVPLSDLLESPPGEQVEYKYVIQGKDGAVYWMEGENLHLPPLEYGTTALVVQDTWGFGYREIQFERLAEESLLELLKKEEMSTRNALGSMVDQAVRDLSNTLEFCESVSQQSQQSQRTDENVLNADRELAAAATRATQILRASEALFYMDSV
jgi:hypothetical protein